MHRIRFQQMHTVHLPIYIYYIWSKAATPCHKEKHSEFFFFSFGIRIRLRVHLHHARHYYYYYYFFDADSIKRKWMWHFSFRICVSECWVCAKSQLKTMEHCSRSKRLHSNLPVLCALCSVHHAVECVCVHHETSYITFFVRYRCCCRWKRTNNIFLLQE